MARPPAHSLVSVRWPASSSSSTDSNVTSIDVALLVDRDGDVADREVGLVLGLEGEVVGEVARSAQVVEDLGDPLGQRGQLELLALHDDETSALARLEQEEAVADLAAHAHHDLVGGVEDVVHEAMSSLSDPVLLTLSTTGVESVKTMALTEHVEMTVRWKRSRGTPWA